MKPSNLFNAIRKEENEMNSTRSIEVSQFIILGYDKTLKKYSMSPTPHIHTDYGTAVTEAKRLATTFHGRKFIVVAIASAFEYVEPVNANIRASNSI